MEFNFASSIICLGQGSVFQDFVFANQPVPVTPAGDPTEIQGGSSTVIAITGTTENP